MNHTGRCTCREVRYQMKEVPLIVHCCHCTWCQRETGSAFVLNAMIEERHVEILKGEIEVIDTPSESGKGQKIARCSACSVALWSVYSGAGPKFLFLRVGTLDEPGAFPPDIHIFTSTKLPWLQLPPGMRAVPEYYRRSEVWPEASLRRREAELARV